MRNAIHVLGSLLLWCLFGYYWYLVSRTQINQASLEALGILGLIMVVGLVLTLWWVAHNRRLARRNRRTTPPSTVPETFDTDYLGRPLNRPSIDVLKAAQVLDIEIQAGTAGKAPEVKAYLLPEGEVA